MSENNQRLTVTWQDNYASGQTIEASIKDEVLHVSSIVYFIILAMELFGFSRQAVKEELIEWAHEFEGDEGKKEAQDG